MPKLPYAGTAAAAADDDDDTDDDEHMLEHWLWMVLLLPVEISLWTQHGVPVWSECLCLAMPADMTRSTRMCIQLFLTEGLILVILVILLCSITQDQQLLDNLRQQQQAGKQGVVSIPWRLHVLSFFAANAFIVTLRDCCIQTRLVAWP